MQRKISFKKAVLATVGGAALLTALSVSALAANVTAKQSVYVRQSANQKSAILTVMNQGTTTESLGTSGNWTKVTVNGKTGYAYTTFLTAEASTDTAASSTALYTTAAVNVRAAANNSSKIVLTAAANTKVEKLGTSGNWIQVKVNGKTGYIYKKYLTEKTDTTAAETKPADTQTKPADAQTTALYTTAAVNVRAAANNSSKIVLTAAANTKVEKLGTSGNWIQVKVNGKTGYIYKKYLSESANGTTSTTSTAAAQEGASQGTEFADVLGSSTTYYNTEAAARTNNIELAVASCNGTVLKPGESFSFNQIVGPRTSARGYQKAIVFSAGQEVEGLGGGICQVSSTIYMAALYADLNITERRYHQFQVTYTPISQDATVSYGSQDFCFRNNTDYPVKIVASTSGGTLKVSILGTKTSDKTVTLNSYATSTTSTKKTAVLYKTVTENGKSTTTKENTSTYIIK